MHNNNNNNNNDWADILSRKIGRMVTVFTESGGASGCGFTGLLIEVNCDFIKLITELPCPPDHPFGINSRANCFCSCRRGNRCRRDELGTIIIIKIDEIVSVVFNEI